MHLLHSVYALIDKIKFLKNLENTKIQYSYIRNNNNCNCLLSNERIIYIVIQTIS